MKTEPHANNAASLEDQATMNGHAPTPAEVIQQWQTLEGIICRTPTVRFPAHHNPAFNRLGKNVWLKLELLQLGGSFKVRAALGHVKRLAGKCAGVITASGGNHAVALAFAAHFYNVPAKVVVPAATSPMRIGLCESYGAEVIKVGTISEVFSTAAAIARDENFEFVHPFDGYDVALGTGGVAHEMLLDNPAMDAIVVPIGGGGLISGIANYIKQVNPRIKMFGVEPATAAVISKSLAAGSPQQLSDAASIADCLCAPLACDYSFNLIKTHVDRVVTLTESEIKQALLDTHQHLKLAVEPAAACALAAMNGPLFEELQQFNNPCLVICGSNIDSTLYANLLAD